MRIQTIADYIFIFYILLPYIKEPPVSISLPFAQWAYSLRVSISTYLIFNPPRYITTEGTAIQICELLATGRYSYDKIAETTKSSYSIVKKIKNGVRWTLSITCNNRFHDIWFVTIISSIASHCSKYINCIRRHYSISSSGVQRYNDIVNDLDFLSKFKYTGLLWCTKTSLIAGNFYSMSRRLMYPYTLAAG